LNNSIETAESPAGVFVCFILHPHFKEMSGSMLFYSFDEEAVKEKRAQPPKAPSHACAVCLQCFGRLIQI